MAELKKQNSFVRNASSELQSPNSLTSKSETITITKIQFNEEIQSSSSSPNLNTSKSSVENVSETLEELNNVISKDEHEISGKTTNLAVKTISETQERARYSRFKISARKTARFKLEEMEWYFGNITRQESEELLGSCDRDAFLVRTSSIEGAYAVSLYEVATKSFSHGLISPTENGTLKFADFPEEYNDLISLVLQCPELLKYATPPRTNEWIEKSQRSRQALQKNNEDERDDRYTTKDGLSRLIVSNVKRENELHVVVKKGDLITLKALLSDKTKLRELLTGVDQMKRVPLVYAISLDRVEMVERILRCYVNLDINAKDEDGNTILHRAVMNCTTRSLLPLLHFKHLKVNITNLGMNSPLHYFCQHFSSAAIEPLSIMLEKGADVNTKNNYGETPLHRVMLNPYSASIHIAKHLITKANASIDPVSKFGETPLHVAARRNKEGLVSLLLQHGANPFLKQDDGLTPYDIAIGNNNLKIAELIKRGPIKHEEEDEDKGNTKKKQTIFKGTVSKLLSFRDRSSSDPEPTTKLDQKREKTLEKKQSSNFKGIINIQRKPEDSVNIQRSPPPKEPPSKPKFDLATGFNDQKGRYFERNEIIRELFETEFTYITDLELLDRDFIQPLNASDVIEPNFISDLLSNFEEILALSQKLTSAFKKIKIDDNSLVLISDAFLNLEDSFLVFVGFCSNQEKAIKTLIFLKKNPKFHSFCEQVFSSPEFRQLGLEPFLMKPIQRLTKYPLLLESLKHKTPKDHPEFGKLEQCINTIRDLIADTNTKIGRNKRIEEIKNVLTTRELDALFDTREVLRESSIKMNTSKKKTIDVQIILMPDNFLVLKPTKQRKLVVYAVCPISLILIQDIRHPIYPYVFEVINVSKKEKYQFITTTYLDLMIWLEDIQTQIDSATSTE